MRVVIYCKIKDFNIKTNSENHVITHLDVKNEKPIQLFGSKKDV